MGKKKIPTLSTVPQPYPRIEDETSPEAGYIDEKQLAQHPNPRQLTIEGLSNQVRRAVLDANKKARRTPNELPTKSDTQDEEKYYYDQGFELFRYFHDYPSDPAQAAHEYQHKTFVSVGNETFRNWILQKSRMNSGYRYQYLAAYCAKNTGRFESVSEFNNPQSDITAKIQVINDDDKFVHIYVSVKNRKDTIGGQDFPNSIEALETAAKTDKDRTGPYCCVFGIAMERGNRRIPRNKSKVAWSINTEVWPSDFFWPFFTSYSYEEIMTAVLDYLEKQTEQVEELPTEIDAPERLLGEFGLLCKRAGLVNDAGIFDKPKQLVSFFCNKLPSIKTKIVKPKVEKPIKEKAKK